MDLFSVFLYSCGGANVKHCADMGRKNFSNVCTTPQTFIPKKGCTDSLSVRREPGKAGAQVADRLAIIDLDDGLRLGTYIVRPPAALAALVGRALACMPVPSRRQTACSPNCLLHHCRTSVLCAVRPPCHRANDRGSYTHQERAS